MSTIKEDMPLLVRHEGDWQGSYTTIDSEGNIIDKHNSFLTCEFPENGSYPYYQVNKYQWDDGKEEEHLFPATYRDKKIWFDTERLEGDAREVDDSVIILRFTSKLIPDVYVYEMIHLSSCGNLRNRTMHWFKNNQLFQRVLVQEHRVK